MGTREESTPAKASKPPSTQEIPTTPSYTDWPSSMQAYYNAGGTPPTYYPSTVAPQTPHPYMWGGQHPHMPPYPYPVMYPPGGVYVHPNMAMTPNSVQTGTELEGKGPEAKDRASAKKSKGTSGSAAPVGSKATETLRAASGSGNDGASQSADSGSEGSTDGSEENGNQQEFSASKKGSFNQMLAEGANAKNTPQPVPAKPVPATNLSIGMDLWPAAAGGPKMGPNASSASAPAIMPEQWIQDERELKRQKRKQSNRESARRSRLRKQAECEELQQKVEALTNDNRALRDELRRVSEECENLTSDNNYMKEELAQLCGPEAVANTELENNEGEEA